MSQKSMKTIAFQTSFFLKGLCLGFFLSFFFGSATVRAFTCEIKPFRKAECQHENLFDLYGTRQIERMNQNFGKDLTQVYKDETAHPESEIRFLIQSLRDYDACFTSLCGRVEACEKTTNLHFKAQINKCFYKQSQFRLLQEAKIEYVLSHNVGRKFRSLYETKVTGLNTSFQPHIHTHIMGINGAITSAIRIVVKLIQYPG